MEIARGRSWGCLGPSAANLRLARCRTVCSGRRKLPSAIAYFETSIYPRLCSHIKEIEPWIYINLTT